MLYIPKKVIVLVVVLLLATIAGGVWYANKLSQKITLQNSQQSVPLVAPSIVTPTVLPSATSSSSEAPKSGLASFPSGIFLGGIRLSVDNPDVGLEWYYVVGTVESIDNLRDTYLIHTPTTEITVFAGNANFGIYTTQGQPSMQPFTPALFQSIQVGDIVYAEWTGKTLFSKSAPSIPHALAPNELWVDFDHIVVATAILTDKK